MLPSGLKLGRSMCHSLYVASRERPRVNSEAMRSLLAPVPNLINDPTHDSCICGSKL